jgi:hypothetical protein
LPCKDPGLAPAGFGFNRRILFQFPAIIYMQLWGALCK